MSPREMNCYPGPAKDGFGHERAEARRSVNSPDSRQGPVGAESTFQMSRASRQEPVGCRA